MLSWDRPLTWMTNEDWAKIQVAEKSFHLFPAVMALVPIPCPLCKLCLTARL